GDVGETVNPDGAPGGRHHAIHQVEVRTPRAQLATRGARALPVVRVQVGRPETRLIPSLERIAEQLPRVRAHVGDLPGLNAGLPRRRVGRLEQQPQARLALPQRLLRRLALADVERGADEAEEGA